MFIAKYIEGDGAVNSFLELATKRRSIRNFRIKMCLMRTLNIS